MANSSVTDHVQGEWPRMTATEFYYKSNLTLEKCSELLGVPKKTFENWHHGRTKPVQIASYWMYHVAKINGIVK